MLHMIIIVIIIQNFLNNSNSIGYHCYSKADIMKKDMELQMLKKSNGMPIKWWRKEWLWKLCKNGIQLGNYYLANFE